MGGSGKVVGRPKLTGALTLSLFRPSDASGDLGSNVPERPDSFRDADHPFLCVWVCRMPRTWAS